MKCPGCGADDENISDQDCEACSGSGYCQYCDGVETDDECDECQGDGDCPECQGGGVEGDHCACGECGQTGPSSDFQDDQ
jgi:hypothetical protein